MPKKPSSPRARKTAFVPRAALAGVFAGAGVIPLVATMVAGCGGKDSGGNTITVAMVFVDSGQDSAQLGVACQCFDSSLGVADTGFTFDGPLGVAVQGFEGGMDGGDAARVTDSAFLGVADAGFGGG